MVYTLYVVITSLKSGPQFLLTMYAYYCIIIILLQYICTSVNSVGMD